LLDAHVPSRGDALQSGEFVRHFKD
jgi:hypothetical protein